MTTGVIIILGLIVLVLISSRLIDMCLIKITIFKKEVI